MVTLQDLATKTPLQNALSSMGLQAKQPLLPTVKPTLPTNQVATPTTVKPTFTGSISPMNMNIANSTPQTTSSGTLSNLATAFKNSALNPYQGGGFGGSSTQTPTATTPKFNFNLNSLGSTPSTNTGTKSTGTPTAQTVEQQKQALQKQIADLTAQRDRQIQQQQLQAQQQRQTAPVQTQGQSAWLNQLNNLQQGYAPMLAQQAQAQRDIKNKYLNQMETNINTPQPMEIGEGRAAQLQSIGTERYNAEQAYYNQLQNSMTARAGILGQGITATAPQMQAGMLTNPQTGQPLNPSLVNSAVQRAVQMVQSGTNVNDPQIQAMLNPFGYYGATALNDAMSALSGGSWNPTAQSAVSQSNASIGTQLQQQAVALDTGLRNLEALSIPMQQFLAETSVNPTTNPVYNASINEYIAKFGNTSQAKQYALMLNDIEKFTSQILSAGSGEVPTQITAQMQNISPGTLNARQLGEYLKVLNQLGSTQKSVIDQQIQGALGGASSGAYYGNLGTTATSFTPGAPNTAFGSGIDNIAGQYWLGIASQVGTGLGQVITDPNAISSFIMGAVAF